MYYIFSHYGQSGQKISATCKQFSYSLNDTFSDTI